MVRFDRRTLLQSTAALLAAPTILRSSPATSDPDEINVLAWGDYLGDDIREAFMEESGIKVKVSAYGTNAEAENRLASSEPGTFDLVFPSLDAAPNYYSPDLLQPIDESRLDVGRIMPSIYRASADRGAVRDGRRFLVPFNWGTEGLTWDSEVHPDLDYGSASFGDVWEEDLQGASAIRPSSALIGLALHLDATGDVPSNRAMDLYGPPRVSSRAFKALTAHATRRKAAIGAFWSNATEATAAFAERGCSIGQTWDVTGIRLNWSNGRKWRYTMPTEGGIGWVDTMAIPAGARRLDQSYALMNFLMRPEIAAMFANETGYNPAAVGAVEHLRDDLKAAYGMAYPDEAAIGNIWWWPPETATFAAGRAEFIRVLREA